MEKSNQVIWILVACGVMVSAGWWALAVVPARWRRMAETSYLISVAVVYSAVIILTGINHG